MASQISLDGALDDIQSDVQKTRDNGLTDLGRVLQLSKLDPGKKISIKDKSIHAACEKLFHAVSSDRSNYINRNSVRSTAASRLSACAQALRLLVEGFMSRMKGNTVAAILGHVLQCLPNKTTGRFCAPLDPDYVKILSAILQHSAHVEHLSHEDWAAVGEFCIETLRMLMDDLNSGRSKASEHFRTVRNAVDFMNCIQSLTAVSNAPLLNLAEKIFSVVVDFINAQSTSASAHAAAFQAINACLKSFSTYSRKLTLESLLKVLPNIRDLWPRTDLAVREQMLISLIHSKLHLSSLRGEEEIQGFLPTIEALIQVFSRDYLGPRKRDHLKLEELTLHTRGRPAPKIMPMQGTSFSLRNSNREADHNWTVLYFLAFFINYVDSKKVSSIMVDGTLQEERASKRRKASSKLEDLVALPLEMPLSENSNVYKLQIIAFVLHTRCLNPLEIETLLTWLADQVAHKNVAVSSWAMLALANLSLQKDLDLTGSDPEFWSNLWHTAVRSVSSIPHCRAACHLLDCLICSERVKFEIVSNSMDSLLTSAFANGPAVMCDSALSMWSNMCSYSLGNNPSQNLTLAYTKMFNWIRSNWKPRSFEEKERVNQITQNVTVRNIADAFQAIVGQSLYPSSCNTKFAHLAQIGQEWILQLNQTSLLNYLLLIQEDNDNPSVSVQMPHIDVGISSFLDCRMLLWNQVLSFFSSEAEEMHTLWVEMKENRSAAITEEIIQVIISFCTVGSLVSNCFLSKSPEQSSERVEALNLTLSNLTKSVASFITSVKDNTKILPVLDIISAFLPDVSAFQPDQHIHSVALPLSAVIQPLAETLEITHNDPDSLQMQNGSETIDDFDLTRGSKTLEALPLSRHQYAASCDLRSFMYSVLAYVRLLNMLLHSIQANEDCNINEIPSDFIKSLRTMSPLEFASSRPLLSMLFNSNLLWRPQEVIQHLEAVLRPYEWNRCEVVLGICLDVLVATAGFWSTSHALSAEYGAGLYEYFMDTALTNKILSNETQINLCDLLYKLLAVNSEYSQSDSEPSVRTRLFQILRDGDVAVQYHISLRLVHVFDRFTLNQHEIILGDIHESLPNDLQHPEGLCLRMLIFTQIGLIWKNLSRLCIYYILVTAGVAPEIINHAKRCVDYFAKDLELPDSRRVFRLFSPQILHTWLEQQDLDKLPFSIFDYSDLRSMLQDAKAQFMSQLLISGSEVKIKDFEEKIGEPLKDVISDTFGQVAAYGIAKDISLVSPDGTHSHAAEVRIRELIGRNFYLLYLRQNFPIIVGNWFLRLDQEQQFEKALSRRPEYEYALKALHTIKELSSSEIIISQSQPPNFKSRVLLEEIARLCRRLDKDPLKMWSPNIVVQVARMLFEDSNPAFGSIHARQTIQRLRLLVCLARDTSTSGYPLEMLLHGVRPFTTNSYCADDAIGLFQYLLENGREHLARSWQFYCGTCLNLMLSLRDFLHAEQDSTTQESQYRATISKAKALHDWLLDHSTSAESPVSSSKYFRSFRSMMYSASRLAIAGQAVSSTENSKMVLLLLKDIDNESKVLKAPFIDSCLRLLCKDFIAPEAYSDDPFSEDETSADYSLSIWKSLKVTTPNENYLQWAAKSLGRGFGYAGFVDPRILRETNLSELQSLQRDPKLSVYGYASRVMVMRSVVEILWDHRPNVVGLAEHAITQIIHSYQGSPELPILESAVRDGIIDSFRNCEIVPKARRDTKELGVLQQIGNLEEPFQVWVTNLSVALTLQGQDEMLHAISPLLEAVAGLAERVFPCILHLHLLTMLSKQLTYRDDISTSLKQCFTNTSESALPHLRVLLNSMLYLRSQPLPQENTEVDRNEWLLLDYSSVASAARRCGMIKTALLAIELERTMKRRQSQTRSSDISTRIQRDLLISVFRQLDEPDSFYGVEQDSDLQSTAERLEYEGDNLQSLLLGSAKMDSLLRSGLNDDGSTSSVISTSLSKLSLNSITNEYLQKSTNLRNKNTLMDIMIESATKLRQWDVPIPSKRLSNDGVVYRALQTISSSKSPQIAQKALNSGLGYIIQDTKQSGWLGSSIPSAFRALCVLTEIGDVISSQGHSELVETWNRLQKRKSWMENSTIENVSQILSCREALLSILNYNTALQESLKTNIRDARLLEVEVGLQAIAIYRKLGSLQNSLSSVYYLSSLIQPSSIELKMKFDASVKREIADILWDKGEMVTSIQTLKNIIQDTVWEGQLFEVGRAGLLADIAHRVSYARLQKPEEVQTTYLRSALGELGDVRHGLEAGRVFNEYATYCHNQLENPDNIEELHRSEKFKRQRTGEQRDLQKAVADAKSDKEKHAVKNELVNVRRWLNIDEQEYNRLHEARQQHLASALEHYLRSLAACEEFNTNVMPLVAIWFGHADNEIANKPVRNYSPRVPSKKFAPLMNQLGSRLQEVESPFQSILADIVIRICRDHPYHGMYHVFAGSKTSGGNDSQARSRKSAATTISRKLQRTSKTSEIWLSIQKSNELYAELAKLRSERTKEGADLSMHQFHQSKSVESKVPELKVPPITMSIPFRDDLDYRETPVVTSFQRKITIPSGKSAPKIITAVASDGKRYRQLFKSGKDDLRQDAIMEQVFEQVTSILQENKITRRRNLKIRTYKVVPLDATSGAIEFVEPTISLSEYLNEAHKKYYPEDLKWEVCRKRMEFAEEHNLPARLKEFERIKSRFHPVLRHFFFERFEDPDEWFERRLAYTRSTAAISILGHVLGLGDRHCHNILLDTQTGEVVHIDLGVAFESGKVLPRPETVPFRLTRDIVDGFGILETEGVFRRCCEFTLEVLRTNKSTILTLLNVLRYDPLYSWTISPLRAKRLQNEQESRVAELKGKSEGTSRTMSMRSSAAAQEGVNEEAYFLNQKTREDEGGEADRALSMVERKLANTLSVSATVNELIQQATDDKNLAVLFHGWAPFA